MKKLLIAASVLAVVACAAVVVLMAPDACECEDDFEECVASN